MFVILILTCVSLIGKSAISPPQPNVYYLKYNMRQNSDLPQQWKLIQLKIINDGFNWTFPIGEGETFMGCQHIDNSDGRYVIVDEKLGSKLCRKYSR